GVDRAEAVQSLMLRIASPEDAEPIRSNPFACARAGRRNECPMQRGVVHYAGSGGARQAKIDDFYRIYLKMGYISKITTPRSSENSSNWCCSRCSAWATAPTARPSAARSRTAP